jgi:hypothetical protein
VSTDHFGKMGLNRRNRAADVCVVLADDVRQEGHRIAGQRGFGDRLQPLELCEDGGEIHFMQAAGLFK